MKKGTQHIVAVMIISMATLSTAAFACPGKKHGDNYRQQKMEQLQTYLQLKPNQEAAWNAFVEASKRPERKKHADGDHHSNKHDQASAKSGLDRMEKKVERMKKRLGHAEKRLAAAKSLYAVLTPEQKKVADTFYNSMKHHGYGKHGKHEGKHGKMCKH